MMIDIAVRGLVLQCESITFLDVEYIGIMNGFLIHVEVIYGNLRRSIFDILESDHIA